MPSSGGIHVCCHVRLSVLATNVRGGRRSSPVEKKLEIVLELQRSVAEIRRAAGREGPEPWDRACLPPIGPETERNFR